MAEKEYESESESESASDEEESESESTDSGKPFPGAAKPFEKKAGTKKGSGDKENPLAMWAKKKA